MATCYGFLMVRCHSKQHTTFSNSAQQSYFRNRRHAEVLPAARPQQQRLAVRRVTVSARLGSREILERAIGVAVYTLPLLDGMQYGRYIFAQYPVCEMLFRPLFPLLRFYASIPFSNFVLFFTIYLAVVRNSSFGRFVRFNAMQACVLDILIVLPLIIQRILNPRSGLGLDLLIIFFNTIFICLLGAVIFAKVSCALGRTPRLPIVADAADNQLL